MNCLSDFYRSKAWENFREVVINERTRSDGYLYDEITNQPIIKAYDIILHHVIELTEENYTDVEIALNPDNIKVVSHSTHNRIHNKLGYSKGQVYIVYGSPMSGKRSYVKASMMEGDLLIDMDCIWQCVSGLPRHNKPNRLKSVVFSVWDNLLESVKYRRGKWCNAYVIQALPIRNARERLCDVLGGRLIHIDTDEETCIKRLYENPDGRNIEQWERYIKDYFKQYALYGN